MDLAAWWQARRWRALLELIEQLPAASRLNEAMQNDPDQARLIALAREYKSKDDDEPDRSWSPRVAEFDLTAILLREVVQALASIRADLRKTKPPAVVIPLPRTAVDDALAQIEQITAVQIGSRYGFSEADLN